jgi:hypothetical protein
MTPPSTDVLAALRKLYNSFGLFAEMSLNMRETLRNNEKTPDASGLSGVL